MAFAVAEPADPRRQALEGDPLAGHLDPPVQTLVVGELVEHRLVGRGDVGWIAGQRHPAERALALAEQRTDVRGEEARIVERPVEAAELGLGAQAVAVVEDLAALVHEADHRPAVHGHALAARRMSSCGSLRGHLRCCLGGEVGGHVAQRIVGAGLIGDDVGRESPSPAASGPRWQRCRRARPTAADARHGPARSGRRHRRANRRPRRDIGSRRAGRHAMHRRRCTAPRHRSS